MLKKKTPQPAQCSGSLFYYARHLSWFFLLVFSSSVYAESTSLGDAAANILEPLSLFTGGFYKLCYIVGAMLIVAAGIQYKNYRDNPSAVRFSTPIVLLLLGLALILLPLIGRLSSAAPV